MFDKGLEALGILLGGGHAIYSMGIIVFSIVLTLVMAIAIAVPVGTLLGYGSAYLVERRYGYDGIVIWAMVVYVICIGVCAFFIGVTPLESLSALAAPAGLYLYYRYRNEALAWGVVAAGGVWYVSIYLYLWWTGLFG